MKVFGTKFEDISCSCYNTLSVKCILYYLLRYATFGIKLCIYVFHLVFKKERYLLLNVYCLFSQEGMDYGIQSTLYVLAIFEWSFSTIDLAERIGKGNVRSLINTNLCFCLGVEGFWAGKWFEFKEKDLNIPSANHSNIWLLPLYIIFLNPPHLSTFFYQYHSNEIQGKYSKRLMCQSYFFIFRRL